MNAEYKDYGYTSAQPSARDTSLELAEFFIRLVRSIGGVKTICDLGCGNGYLAAKLGRLGYRVTGLDASNSGIEIARKQYESANVDFVCANVDADFAHAWPMDRRFDAVISSDVIEHLYRPSMLVTAAAVLLKPGGCFMVGTPYHGYLKNLAISAFGRWDAHHDVHWDGGHIKFFSPKTLRELLTRHGFVCRRTYFYGRMPWLWKNMIVEARLGKNPTNRDA